MAPAAGFAVITARIRVRSSEPIPWATFPGDDDAPYDHVGEIGTETRATMWGLAS